MKKDWDEIRNRAGFNEWNALQRDLLTTDDGKLILLAPTGSGKTMAFVLFLIRHMTKPNGNIQSLILVPTRELGQQIGQVLKQADPSVKTAVFYGGQQLRREENILSGQYPDIIISTPGRLLDHLSRGKIDFSHLRILIIDEMDKCLELGFYPDIKKIMRKIPDSRFLILSSATVPPDTSAVENFFKYPLHDFRDNKDKEPKIEIVEIPSFEKDKILSLETLLDALNTGEKAIIFVNHRESATRIYEHLKRDGFPAGLYHGQLDQKEREIALEKLHNGTTPYLVSTDLAARGIDIPDIDNIIHYHLPSQKETFTHRNGRTARAGRSGKVYVIRHNEETLPEFIEYDRRWIPSANRQSEERASRFITLIFNLGKSDKISKGDILGFLIKQLGIENNDIGRITVAQSYSTAAVNRSALKIIKEKDLKSLRLKSHRFLLEISR